MQLEKLVRKNIREMKPYSSARHEFSGEANIFLDANENSFGSPTPSLYNRYPDPQQQELKNRIAELKSVSPSSIFLGNGSDEAIDLLFRIFCNPGKDNVISCPPTYGMYEVCAEMNDVELRSVPLKENFQLDVPAIFGSIDANTKLIFICSPNNPTGNCMDPEDVKKILSRFNGLVVVDEAYVDYSANPSFIHQLKQFENLVVLQTFSKAWGMAALRLGLAFAGESIIKCLNKVKYPYNVNAATQEIVLKALEEAGKIKDWINETISERTKLAEELSRLPGVEKMYPSDANFILAKIKRAPELYRFLSDKGIIVRDRSRTLLCDNCLRITIGTPEENKQLLEAINEFK